MTTKTTKPNVLIVGSGQMGQRIHEQWIEKYNLFNQSKTYTWEDVFEDR